MKGFIWARLGLAVFFIISGGYQVVNSIHEWRTNIGTNWTTFWFVLGVFVLLAWSYQARTYWMELENAIKKGA